jgi:sarcosine oxidase subunit gamma
MIGLHPVSAWATFPRHRRSHDDTAGVIVEDRDGVGLATVIARSGQEAILSKRLQKRFNTELRPGAHRTLLGPIAFLGTAPNGWLAMQNDAANALAPTLEAVVGDAASICDQTDGYALIRVYGMRVRDALAKLMPIDLHPAAFRVDQVAGTISAHMSVTLWRVEDTAAGPTFEIAMFRSLAGSFAAALLESALEYGITLATPSR